MLTPPKDNLVRKDTPLPPPRPGVRYVAVPVIQYVIIADDPLRRRINRLFHWPMIVLALLTLPALGVEFLLRPEPGTWLWWLNWTAIWVIWAAFLIEFVIKIAIAECRLEYCKRNWLDIIIIVLPALRPLRLAYVAKTSRVFTLRGVAMKFARYAFTIVIGLEATERLLHRFGLRLRDQRRDPADMTRHQLMTEVKQLRRLVDDWEAWYEAHQAHLEQFGREPFHRPKPTLHDADDPDRSDDSDRESATTPKPTSKPPAEDRPSSNGSPTSAGARPAAADGASADELHPASDGHCGEPADDDAGPRRRPRIGGPAPPPEQADPSSPKSRDSHT